MDKNEQLIKTIEDTRNSLNTDRLDMSFGEIMSMYERKEIIIDPEFQRLFRWSTYQQSRFMESILLGIPIPPIFVAEDQDGRWELVDGLQRISTVFSYFGLLNNLPDKNNWILEEGELVKEFKNFSCTDLPLKLQLNIKRSVCRIEIVKWNSKYDMRYELFNRLNTGGAALTDQEIRNCIFRGVSSEFNKFLTSESGNQIFIDLVSPTERQLEELYLDELVLRFCSLFNNSENVKENISQHMTDFMKNIVSQPQKIDHLQNIFNRVINLLKPIGKKSFRGANHVFSTSLFDGITVGIAQNIEKYEKKGTPYLIEKIDKLKADSEFKKASGSASNSKTRILKRLRVANQLFAND